MKKEMRDSGEFFGCYDSIIYGGLAGFFLQAFVILFLFGIGSSDPFNIISSRYLFTFICVGSVYGFCIKWAYNVFIAKERLK